MHLALQLIAAAASGAVLALVAPPVNLAWLHWFSFLPLFWTLQAGRTRHNLLMGFVAGFAAQATIFSWLVGTVVRFSNLPAALGVLTLVLFATFYGLIYPAVFGFVMPLRRHLGTAWVLLLPAVLVSVELLFPALFPYYQGVAQYRRPWIWQLTSVTGVWGLSYLVMLVNCVLAEWMYRLRERGERPFRAPVALTVGVALVFLANLGFGAWRYPRVERLLEAAPVQRVGLIQLHHTQQERFRMSARDEVLAWERATRKVADQDVDLVIWPEGASPYNPHEDPMRTRLTRLAQAGGIDILVGGGTSEYELNERTGQKGRVHFNSAWLIGRDGTVRERYDKMVPLPFGEYLPLGETFPILREWIQGPGNFRAGKVPTIFTPSGGVSFACPICYEAILHDVAWTFRSAAFFVNITNDAWFGDTAAPHQHAMLAAVRAVELGRPMVRAAISGINMVVEPHGRIAYETVPFTDEAAAVPVRMVQIETIYWRFGDWFGALCMVATAGALGLLWRRRPRRHTPPLPGERVPRSGG